MCDALAVSVSGYDEAKARVALGPSIRAQADEHVLVLVHTAFAHSRPLEPRVPSRRIQRDSGSDWSGRWQSAPRSSGRGERAASAAHGSTPGARSASTGTAFAEGLPLRRRRMTCRAGGRPRRRAGRHDRQLLANGIMAMFLIMATI